MTDSQKTLANELSITKTGFTRRQVVAGLTALPMALPLVGVPHQAAARVNDVLRADSSMRISTISEARID